MGTVELGTVGMGTVEMGTVEMGTVTERLSNYTLEFNVTENHKMTQI
jgi:hypothetical protein